MKIDVVVYYAKSGGSLYEKERFVVKSLEEARQQLLDWYFIELDHIEWNIREHYYCMSAYEAHIYGYAKDEHIMLTIEDHKSTRVLEICNDIKQYNLLANNDA